MKVNSNLDQFMFQNGFKSTKCRLSRQRAIVFVPSSFWMHTTWILPHLWKADLILSNLWNQKLLFGLSIKWATVSFPLEGPHSLLACQLEFFSPDRGFKELKGMHALCEGNVSKQEKKACDIFSVWNVTVSCNALKCVNMWLKTTHLRRQSVCVCVRVSACVRFQVDF